LRETTPLLGGGVEKGKGKTPIDTVKAWVLKPGGGHRPLRRKRPWANGVNGGPWSQGAVVLREMFGVA
jgi:hypothetical protein